MPSTLHPALRALPLSVVDFVVAAALYEFVSPAVGILLGLVGALLLGCVLVRCYRVAVSGVPARH